ncbi:MAG TPA: ATP-dependent helicase, partial [Opitutaceae bacterium]
MLRLLLPPNLAAAAPRDAISVKIELALDATPPPELLPGLAVLQSICRTPTPPPFVQLSRAQLKQLVEALQGRPVFFWLNQPAQPILWIGPVLRGVSEHLVAEKKPELMAVSASKAPAPAKPTAEPAGRKTRLADGDNARSRLVVDGSEHFLAVTLPSREHIAYNAILDLLKTNGFALEPSTRKWWLRDRHKTLNFLARHKRTLDEEFYAEFTPNFEKNTARLHLAEVACDAVENGDGFN